MLLAQIQWNDNGFLYLFSKQAQTETMDKLGKDNYMKLPTPGTNARGVELTSSALNELVNHSSTKKIEIYFEKEVLDYREIYTKWLDAWHE